MVRVIPYAEPLVYDPRNPLRRPDVGLEAVALRALREDLDQLLFLLLVERGRPSRVLPPPQAVGSTVPVPRPPPAHGALRHPDGLRDLLLGHVSLQKQVDGDPILRLSSNAFGFMRPHWLHCLLN